jgi:type I restriction enzyme S subunit
MTEKKKNIPELRFPEFDGEWQFSKMENHFDFKNGLNKEKEYFGKGTPIVNFTDVLNKTGLKNENISGRVTLTPKEINNYSAKKGDVFFTRTSETINEIGMSATLLDEIPNCVFSGFVLRARPKDSSLDRFFNQYLFNIQSVRKEIITKSSYTTRALTSGTLLNKVEFYYPITKQEQQKIASFLTSVDKRIQQLTKKKELLEKYKKGIMQKIFSQQIRFKDDDGKDFPAWEEKRLEEIAIVIMGQSPDSNSYNTVSDGIYLIQGNADISSRATKPRNWTNAPTKLCQINDIILTVRAPVGEVAISHHKACIGRGVCAIRNKGDNQIQFIYQYLLFIENKWDRLSQGSTFTAVSSNEIRRLQIFTPSIYEQQKIADFLSSIDKKIEAVETQLEKTKEFKKGLLQKMFV